MKTVAEQEIEKIKRERKSLKRDIKRLIEFDEEHRDEFARINKGMEVVEEWHISTHIDMNSKSYDLSYSGDKHVLQGCFAALRKLGYKPDKRPETDALTSFSTWFNHPESNLKLWFRFSSTVCKRRKVGTKMVEEDVYEVVCE